MKEVRIGLLGFGVVGRGVVDLLLTQTALLRERTGVNLRLVRIATRTPQRDRGLDLGAVELTADVDRVVAADDIDVVIELIGGLEPAKSLVLKALQQGKHVVTANKALIATHGEVLVSQAAAAKSTAATSTKMKPQTAMATSFYGAVMTPGTEIEAM